MALARTLLVPERLSSHMRARDRCYFDGACSLCRIGAAVLRALDWFRRLEFVDLRGVAPGGLPVDAVAVQRGMPMVTASGRTLVGLPTIRRALGATPVGRPLACVLGLPGVSWLATRMYDWIAAHRTLEARRALGARACATFREGAGAAS